MVKASRTLRKHLHPMLDAVRNGVTNAGTGSINFKIPPVKRMASRFASRASFHGTIYFHAACS